MFLALSCKNNVPLFFEKSAFATILSLREVDIVTCNGCTRYASKFIANNQCIIYYQFGNLDLLHLLRIYKTSYSKYVIKRIFLLYFKYQKYNWKNTLRDDLDKELFYSAEYFQLLEIKRSIKHGRSFSRGPLLKD